MRGGISTAVQCLGEPRPHTPVQQEETGLIGISVGRSGSGGRGEGSELGVSPPSPPSSPPPYSSWCGPGGSEVSRAAAVPVWERLGLRRGRAR